MNLCADGCPDCCLPVKRNKIKTLTAIAICKPISSLWILLLFWGGGGGWLWFWAAATDVLTTNFRALSSILRTLHIALVQIREALRNREYFLP